MIFEDCVEKTSAPRGEKNCFLSVLVVSKPEEQKKSEKKAENKAGGGRVSISTPSSPLKGKQKRYYFIARANRDRDEKRNITWES